MTDPTTLPTGTITFLFTDIEGSTRLLGQLGERYPALLEEHQRLLREVFERHDGVEVSTEGDSFFVVFRQPTHALAAAVEAQRALADHAWPEDGSVRVRIGLHTGEGKLGADNYVGLDLHRAARVAASGHGGQIVLSEGTKVLVQHGLPEGVSLRDLGEHRLKDLAAPEHLYQADIEGLPSEFPPVRTLDARATNIPRQLTTFVGRERELGEVRALIERSRLVTLVGPGGTGKSRLAIQLASDLLPAFPDGVFLVALASVTDPGMVVSTITETLGIPENLARPSRDVLVDHLRDRKVLLVLDNLEQVLGAASDVEAILAAGDTRILATSREPLGLVGEQEYAIPPLSVPDPERLPPLDELSSYEALALFVDRASSVKPGFELTDANAAAVAEICARLDGLPLAIELAAARVKLLSPEQLLARLGDRLALASGKARNRPERQQTLRGAIAWSYDLLDGEERAFFERLGVFVGGFSIEAAEAVANPDGELGIDTLDGIASLANKSLLRQMTMGGVEDRFLMLGTIREYARERLDASPDAVEIRRRHAAHFLELAERASSELTGAEQAMWLDTLAEEHGNFRSILDDPGCHSTTKLLLATHLWRFWQMRGHLHEATDRLPRLLGQAGDVPLEVRAGAVEAAGSLFYWRGDWKETRRYYEESLRLWREIEDPTRIARALYNLSFTTLFDLEHRDLERSLALLDESIALFEEVDDEQGALDARWFRAFVVYDLGRDGAAGKVQEALEMFQELTPIMRERKDPFRLGWSLHGLGLVHEQLGHLDQAREAYREALVIFAEANDISAYVLLLDDFASLALAAGDEERSARLWGAFTEIRAKTGSDLVSYTHVREGREERLRSLLSDDTTRAAFEEGRRMTADEAVAHALEV